MTGLYRMPDPDRTFQRELDGETRARFPAALLGDHEFCDPHVEIVRGSAVIVDHEGRRMPVRITRTLRQLAFQLERCAREFSPEVQGT